MQACVREKRLRPEAPSASLSGVGAPPERHLADPGAMTEAAGKVYSGFGHSPHRLISDRVT